MGRSEHVSVPAVPPLRPLGYPGGTAEHSPASLFFGLWFLTHTVGRKPSFAFFLELGQKKAENPKSNAQIRKIPFVSELATERPDGSESTSVRESESTVTQGHSKYICYLEGGESLQFPHKKSKCLF